MKKILLIVVSTLIAMHAFANGSISNAKVTQIRIDKSGRGMVIFDRQVSGTPATCIHPAYANALAFDSTTPGGKAIMATALAAKTTGSYLSAYGTGGCAIYGGAHVEDWDYGVID